MKRTAALLFALSSQALLTGCGGKAVVTADALCKDWQHQTVSKNDNWTQGSAAIADGNNHRRENWGCNYGENEAKPTKLSAANYP